METITIKPDKDQDAEIEVYVLEQTRIGGINYVLVTEEEDGDGEAVILKDFSKDGDEESIYIVVEDDAELQAVGQVFQNMMDDDVTLQ